jgi:hypothetical protein
MQDRKFSPQLQLHRHLQPAVWHNTPESAMPNLSRSLAGLSAGQVILVRAFNLHAHHREVLAPPA